MSFGSESESASRADIRPLLAVSELEGQALWMSSRARQTLGDEAGGLLHLQSRFVQHFFRLQNAERSLSRFAQSNAPAAGASAVRQLERERQRLGRDLHTGVGQLLVAIHLQLEVIGTLLQNPPTGVRTALDRIAALTAEAQEQVRSLSHWLHPPDWQRLTLEQAPRQLWDSSGVPQRFQASLTVDPLPREPEQEVKVLVYRAAQEAVTNLARHSRATRVAMTLRAESDRVILRIEDNGVGFDVERLANAPDGAPQGIGLRSIREQAAPLGGKLEITSSPGNTTLVLSAPSEPGRS